MNVVLDRSGDMSILKCVLRVKEYVPQPHSELLERWEGSHSPSMGLYARWGVER